MSKTFRQCVIDYIKNRRLRKGYVDYIVAQLNKLEQIEQIINSWDCAIVTAENDWKYIAKVKKILEQENVDKTCDNCKYCTDAEEIHGKTPCGTCGQELINFCKKESGYESNKIHN